MIDNDGDSRVLYTVLFESYSAAVIATDLVQGGLSLSKRFVPEILVCEARFLGEMFIR